MNVNETDQLRATTRKLQYALRAAIEVELNGLGEVISTHVFDFGIAPNGNMPEALQKEVRERGEAFSVIGITAMAQNLLDKANEEAKTALAEKFGEALKAGTLVGPDGKPLAGNLGVGRHTVETTEDGKLKVTPAPCNHVFIEGVCEKCLCPETEADTGHAYDLVQERLAKN